VRRPFSVSEQSPNAVSCYVAVLRWVETRLARIRALMTAARDSADELGITPARHTLYVRLRTRHMFNAARSQASVCSWWGILAAVIAKCFETAARVDYNCAQARLKRAQEIEAFDVF
jgi:hypothetical protein